MYNNLITKLTTNLNKLNLFIVVLSFFFFGSCSAANYLTIAEEGNYIASKKESGRFILTEAGNAAPLYVSSQDYPGVLRVLNHIQADIANVSNAKPEIHKDVIPPSKEIVIVGTIGKSPVIDQLIKENKLNVDGISGKWETYLITTIEKPFPNIDRAMVITGSDKRGTIFGLYDLSSKIGVSPWYWWADVPVKKQSNLYVLPGRFSIGEPKVKYRGIFINDEAPAFSGWTFEKFGGFNSKMYEHVFELILRMKGNFLWPAMWGRAFYDDDPENPRLADEYGIVVSTSHHEPMMRAHDEWRRYGKGGAWNYEKNKEGLKDFWRKGIERMGDYESVVTLAMRGDGDEAMSPDANVTLLEQIVSDQREILAEVTGKDVTEIPQVWALYKEVQEYYDKGMRVPDDVTLLLCDDNWGNVRHLPDLNDPPRKGGYGMYYHYDFVGGPRNYKWINTNPITRVWEQMHLTYRHGVDRIWVVNVGDIKPMEFPIEFFLDYAWDPEKIPAEKLAEYTKQWSEKQFGKKHAEEIAELISEYTKFNGRRKPEMLDHYTFSLTNYNEWETVVNEFNSLVDRAQNLFNIIAPEYKDAYFQLVLHPAIGNATLYNMYLSVAKNRLYAEQGRAATNHFGDKVEFYFNKDTLITDYYNKVIAQGKWSHMMDQARIGYTSWQQPPRNIMPAIKKIVLPEKAEMGMGIEGSTKWWPNEKGEAVLPGFDVYNQQKYFVEVFNRGKRPFYYSAEPLDQWIMIDNKYGKVETENRFWVSIDWDKTPVGKTKSSITIKDDFGNSVVVNVKIDNPITPKREMVKGFIESNGYISIEANNFAKAIGSSEISWLVIPDMGKTGSSVTPLPVTAKAQTPGGNSPRLEYPVYFFTEGEVTVHAYFSPTQNYTSGNGLHYAVSFNDEKPQMVNVHENDTIPDWKYPREWNEAVGNKIKISTSKHMINKAGEYVLNFWMVHPGLVLQKIVIDTGELKPSYLGPPQSYNRKFDTNK